MLRIGSSVAVAFLAAGLLAPVAHAQQKPPAQVINLGDVRRLAEACEDWAGTLDQATRGLQAGTISADTGGRVEQVKQRVQPICLKQDSVHAGQNLPAVVQGIVDVAGMIP